MNIVKQEGCMAWCLDADGKPIRDMDEAQKLEILSKLVKLYNIETEELIDYIVRAYGDYSCSDRPCECCGDYIETWKSEIEL